MNHRAPRVLVLGFDAMDPDLVLDMARAGRLPAFRSLLETGSSGPTLNPPGLYVGAIWPSFFTGASPTRHGRYCYAQLVPGTYAVERFKASRLRCPPFWKVLSDGGRRVAVVDVPKSPAVPGLNGIQLRDWGTHDPEQGARFETWPPELADEITSRFGKDPIGQCDEIDRSERGVHGFIEGLEHRIRAKTAIVEDLVARDSWDLFLAVFAESHCVGHQCWAVHDPGHPAHDAALAAAVGDPVERVYQALDTALGKLLALAGPETRVLVLASHGMGPHWDATFMLPEILDRLEPWHSRLRTWLHPRQEWFVRGITRRRRWIAPTPRVDHLRCYAVPNNDVFGGIRVNLMGREPRGSIRSGAEYDALYEELRRELLALVNIATGGPVARDLHRATDLYPGEPVGELPDFLVEWHRDHPISAIRSPRIGELRKRYTGVRNGDHRPAGYYWTKGPGIAAGGSLPETSVMNFAPTICSFLEVEVSGIDGRALSGGEV